MDWAALDYEKIANAIVILVIGLATGLGIRSGRRSAQAAAPAERAVEVAGALIDSSSAKELTAAIEAQTMEMINGRKTQERAADALGKKIEDLTDKVGALIVEVARRH
ncbi:hypothetical protein DEM27_00240 [Metarhizobium album]|uniref:Uncharacterized protein n=1 Tax=Metarhizobium album TaxID=2182425 RepID=A0A2U2DWI0_9HYPH|nr:hypothetical protein [Rhizobium album]PWE57678.1 hypothetical protein DEM27_00240 [Rhizobium album]